MPPENRLFRQHAIASSEIVARATADGFTRDHSVTARSIRSA
jgi:hypothetical protein